jgi:hypothetical protein
MCFRQIISISQGLLVPIIACITVYIAYQQLRTNQHKTKLDLFNRRFKVHEETKKILSLIIRDLNPNDNDLRDFNAATSEADFLFEPEVREYINKIFQHAASLTRWNTEYRDNNSILPAPKDYDHRKVTEGKNNETLWFEQQWGSRFAPVKDIFRKYLDFSQLH